MCCFFIVLCYISLNFAFSFCRFIKPGIIVNYVLHSIIYSIFSKEEVITNWAHFVFRHQVFLWKRCQPPPLYSPFRLCLEIFIEKKTWKMVKMLLCNFPRKIWIKKISNYKTNCLAYKFGWFWRYRKYKFFWLFLHLILINHLFELVKDSFVTHSRLALNHYFSKNTRILL